ncbi:putative porin [Dongia mobilis]|uniref:Putative porin n=1 Tax=Dongia mobilis TaxID=578943 RepID=A0A4R6WP69_9PROT|nr:porin [Dongia mobilis]TDQ82984.1 putative porin [Dongia mobilis]
MMRQLLIGSSALIGVNLLTGQALASDGVKLSLGGFIYSAFGVAFDDDGAGEAGDNINLSGVGTDAELHFSGSVTLDNGITVGAKIELEGGDEDGDQIDQAYAHYSGGFGEFRIGVVDGAAGNMYMLPPGSTSNFGPYSPETTGAALSPGFFDPENLLTIKDKPQKLVYFSPQWGGFSFAASYTPNDDEKTYNGGDNIDGAWRPDKPAGSASNNFALAAHFTHEGEDWGIDLGAAAYWEGDVNRAAPGDTEQAGYNAGANFMLGPWTIGAAGTFLDDGNGAGNDIWVTGVGLTYGFDRWTVGGGWAHAEIEQNGSSDNDVIDRAGITANYDLGPGISLDGGIFYTWGEAADDGADPSDEYDAIEFSIGSAITF